MASAYAIAFFTKKAQPVNSWTSLVCLWLIKNVRSSPISSIALGFGFNLFEWSVHKLSTCEPVVAATKPERRVFHNGELVDTLTVKLALGREILASLKIAL
ncbi:MAG TPA: hypothetical protein V6C91_20225 [Coleofasciculaceae cyanobacterium]